VRRYFSPLEPDFAKRAKDLAKALDDIKGKFRVRHETSFHVEKFFIASSFSRSLM
jgi:hypothetical protein